jgi:hypothetical protein
LLTPYTSAKRSCGNPQADDQAPSVLVTILKFTYASVYVPNIFVLTVCFGVLFTPWLIQGTI